MCAWEVEVVVLKFTNKRVRIAYEGRNVWGEEGQLAPAAGGGAFINN